MIIKLVPPKNKDEFDLIEDIRTLKDSKIGYGQNFIIYEFPLLPKKFNKVYFSKQEKINLYNFSCTCQQFEDNSKHFSDRDIRRACKHIYYKASVTWLREFVGEITVLLLHKAVFNGFKFLYKINIFKQEFYFIINPESAWVNVITLKDDSLAVEYTYHTIQKRWGHANTPDEAAYIIDQIQKIIKFQLPVNHPYKTFSEIEKL